MAIMHPGEMHAAPRRVVLIDLDWQEADLVPELLRRPGINVRLVAGESDENAGFRVAELCGLPRTVELADLTREIFDLALLGERSARRTQVERLLTALGTPIASPLRYLDPAPRSHPPTQPGEAVAAPDGSGGNGHADPDLDAVLIQALPDLATRASEIASVGPESENLPDPGDRAGLERVLAGWARATGAKAAVLHAGAVGGGQRTCRVGLEDPLLDALVQLALELDAPHVVSRLEGPDRDQAWGAWPFRTRGHRGVLAAASIDPVEGRAVWEQAVQALRVSWESGDHERLRNLGGTVRPGWIAVQEFRSRVAAATEQMRRDGTHPAVHRLRFADARSPLERFCLALPERLRESDSICRVGSGDVLFLHGDPGTRFSHLRRRLVALWEQAWRDEGRPTPAPPITEERIELMAHEDADAFLATVTAWLGGA